MSANHSSGTDGLIFDLSAIAATCQQNPPTMTTLAPVIICLHLGVNKKLNGPACILIPAGKVTGLFGPLPLHPVG